MKLINYKNNSSIWAQNTMSAKMLHILFSKLFYTFGYNVIPVGVSLFSSEDEDDDFYGDDFYGEDDDDDDDDDIEGGNWFDNEDEWTNY